MRFVRFSRLLGCLFEWLIFQEMGLGFGCGMGIEIDWWESVHGFDGCGMWDGIWGIWRYLYSSLLLHHVESR